jgi:hypothetical protein
LRSEPGPEAHQFLNPDLHVIYATPITAPYITSLRKDLTREDLLCGLLVEVHYKRQSVAGHKLGQSRLGDLPLEVVATLVEFLEQHNTLACNSQIKILKKTNMTVESLKTERYRSWVCTFEEIIQGVTTVPVYIRCC